MQIINKGLNEIKPYANNPRNNDGAVQYVANSIKEFGFKVPIVIDKNGEIVAGHTRYKAAKKLKLTEVPCIIADDLTEEQVKAFRLADNKVAEAAEWDFELLVSELDDIIDFDMTDFGFDHDFDTEDDIDMNELEKDNEKTGRVIVSINIPNVAEWNLIEDEVKRIAEEINATVAVKLE